MSVLLEAPAGPQARGRPLPPDGSVRTPDVLASSSPLALEVALAILTVASVAGLHRSFRGWGSDWVGPVFLTVVATLVVCHVSRRHLISPLIGAVVDLVALGLFTVWTVVPSSTFHGLPAAGTWQTVGIAIADLPEHFASATAPVHPDVGFLLVAVFGAGSVAVLGSWSALRLGRILLGALPAFAAFVVCSAIGTRSGRDWATVIVVAALIAYLLTERSNRAPPAGVTLGPLPTGRSGDGVAVGAVIAVVAVAATTVIVPGLRGADGHGPLGWHSFGQSTTRIVVSPLVSLRTRLLTDGTRPVLKVTSSQPSYWRLTSLDDFDGYQWNAGDTYQGVGRALPGVVRPPGTRQVTESFDIQDLSSPWAPLAFDPEAVTGAGKVSYDPRSGSLLTPGVTSNGLRYTVQSVQYLATLSSKDLGATRRLSRAHPPAGYLQLPSSIPTSVRRLAPSIVRGKKTEYAKAYALQAFFHTHEFSYSLHPPSDGSGTATLYNFLFVTHTGYCQQFAGAYAVLARLDGLPTRLAVGFTTGTKVGADTYQVTDADAHTWPEVWFPSYGWIPFEPTQGPSGQGFVIPGAAGYTGNTGIRTQGGRFADPRTRTQRGKTAPLPVATAPAGTLPGDVRPAPAINPHTVVPRGETSGSGTARSTHKALPHRPKGAATSSSLGVVTFVAAAAAVLAMVNEGVRRRRWRRRRMTDGTDPEGARGAVTTLAAWSEVEETLTWHGIRRGRSETFGELAERAAGHHEFDRRGPGGGQPAGDLRHLAQHATRAAYTGSVAADLVVEAEIAALSVRRALRDYRTRPHRLRVLLDPHLAWLAPVGSAPPRTADDAALHRLDPWAAHSS